MVVLLLGAAVDLILRHELLHKVNEIGGVLAQSRQRLLVVENLVKMAW